MHVPFWKVAVGLLMVANGFLFAGQVYLFDQPAAALRIHSDLPPEADPALVNLKVGAWALAGLAFIVAGAGLMAGRRDWLPAGLVGFLLVDGLYVAQFWLFGASYLGVWAGFATFGLLALGYAAVCRYSWRTTAGLA